MSRTDEVVGRCRTCQHWVSLRDHPIYLPSHYEDNLARGCILTFVGNDTYTGGRSSDAAWATNDDAAPCILVTGPDFGCVLWEVHP